MRAAAEDVSAVGKFVGGGANFSYNIGAAAGMTTQLYLTDDRTTSKYSLKSESQMVARGFAGVRYDFGLLGIMSEVGYQYLKTPQVKDNDDVLTLNGADVELDLSGVYFAFGFGFNF